MTTSVVHSAVEWDPGQMQQGMRLHYIDWLRVSAFAIVILYHSSVAFFPDLAWLVRLRGCDFSG